MTCIAQYLEKQPITNIGMLGSVSDGKSTTVYQLTGTKTQKHSSELKRNITIKPGYANMKIYRDNEDKLISCNSSENKDYELLHHISFIDCPGHYELIITMLSNINLMDGAIVVVSAAEPISKKPQLLQHLLAVKIANFENVIICLNKLDLVSKKVALERKKELDNLLEQLKIKPKVIIPVCMNKKLGIDNLLKAIMKYFPNNKEINQNDKVQFRVSRSFDINKKNINYKDVNGGVLGGSLISGNLKVGDNIEIKPGLIKQKENGEFECRTLKTEVLSLQTDSEKLNEIIPGGLIGIGTNIDPFYCKNDNFCGSVVGLEGLLPEVYDNFEMNLVYNCINFDESNEWNPEINETINLQISTNTVSASITHIDITNINDTNLKLKLSKPVCIDNDMLIIISKYSQTKNLNILGYGFLNI